MRIHTFIDRDHRVTVARAWRVAAGKGETQAAFCSRQMPQISPRTLRQWVKAFAPAEPPQVLACSVVERALAELRELLGQIELENKAPTRSLELSVGAPPGTPGGSSVMPLGHASLATGTPGGKRSSQDDPLIPNFWGD